jgi:hypothetical protein
MLNTYGITVAKVDLVIAYTCMLQAYVLSVFKCFICMCATVCICLQWFSNILRHFYKCLRFLQLLHLDVSKVDRVLHMGCAWEAADGVEEVWGGMVMSM